MVLCHEVGGRKRIFLVKGVLAGPNKRKKKKNPHGNFVAPNI